MDIFQLYNDMKYFRIDFAEHVEESDLAFVEEILQRSFDMSLQIKIPDIKLPRAKHTSILILR